MTWLREERGVGGCSVVGCGGGGGDQGLDFLEGRSRKAGLTLSVISLSDRGQHGGAVDICSREASSLPLTLAGSGMGGELSATGGWAAGGVRRVEW